MKTGYFLLVLLLLCGTASTFVAFSAISWRSSRQLNAPILNVISKNKNHQNKYVQWTTVPANDPIGSLVTQFQTSVTTFVKDNVILELHALLHVGEACYFDHFHSHDFQHGHHTVLFELLLDQSLLDSDTGRLLQADIQASPNDKQLAQSYSWTCQADALNFTAPHWRHADLTRQEYQRLVSLQQQQQQPSNNNNNPYRANTWRRPDVATALVVGPPAVAYQSRSLNRRLFTNLFLPGDALAIVLRLLLWVGVPSPEVSILLLDWSSTWWRTNGNDNGTHTARNVYPLRFGAWSPVTQQLWRCLVTFQVSKVRRLLFGQVVYNGHVGDIATNDRILIGARNDRALEVLDTVLVDGANNKNDPQTIALLYGCNHCPDLTEKLLRRGFSKTTTTWRTVWSLPQDETPQRVGGVLVVVFATLYLLVGGLDWVATVQDVQWSVDAANHWQGGGWIMAYVLRHALLYVGLSKLVLDVGEQ